MEKAVKWALSVVALILLPFVLAVAGFFFGLYVWVKCVSLFLALMEEKSRANNKGSQSNEG